MKASRFSAEQNIAPFGGHVPAEVNAVAGRDVIDHRQPIAFT
jgi:predicted nucleic acid-binding protein/virulence-associated protein VagC